MIIIKTEAEINRMHEAGKILAECHRQIAKLIQPGITTHEIDQFAEKFMKQNGATPEQKGYNGYQYATCASTNDIICHGFPKKEKLKEGDIVTIDMVVNLNGWLADSAWSYAVGEVTDEAKHLLAVTEKSLYLGIEQALIGKRIGDVSHAIQSYAEAEGFSVVRDFIGHGIGKDMHEDPQVPHYGPPDKGPRIKEGMVFTIEPMLNAGTYFSKLDSDGWTARTRDGRLSAQYEHTIAITKDGPLILTQQ
ncbi:type I methionyl aminopeptidase [Paenibacillus algorifonticola]|uniref:Methionine aminopeptidase n=1 Tax=Paenibacillus sp. BIHB 4019 TaxID=1870819 RepID=A0A1B2DGF4_9BACL|nr:type I methionyl aminopeptidase [Paenibacillus sp. BIHB 4019]ANY66792.1 type I methionyl aminopeptidase [Paenibacillus sp. BIHB 4019]